MRIIKLFSKGIFKNNRNPVFSQKHIDMCNGNAVIEHLVNADVLVQKGDKQCLFKKIKELEAINQYMNTEIASLKKCNQERAKTIGTLNKKLDKYAFSNSHKVRAPLARLLGLTKLLQIDAIGNDERVDVNKKLLNAAVELEVVVSDITKSLEHNGCSRKYSSFNQIVSKAKRY